MEFIVLYLFLGSFIGVAAGMLGIGGGMIIVPVLIFAFTKQGVSSDVVLPLAVGTSLATIIVTSFSSVLSHYRRNNLDFSLLKKMAFGFAVGGLVGSLVLKYMNPLYWKLLFVSFAFYIAFKLWFNVKVASSNTMPSTVMSNMITFVFGILSSFFGIGGGTFTVPYLIRNNIPMVKTIACASCCGLPVAIMGVLGFVIGGYGEPSLPSYSFGFVNLVAAVCIASTSYWTAKLGVHLANTLPVAIVKKVFAVLQITIALQVLFSIFSAL